MKKIDFNTWERLSRFMFFKSMSHPRYSLSTDIDITSFYAYVKKEGLSFYLSMMHLLMTEINQVEAFKYRIIDHEVYLCDVVHPSFTDSITGTDDFKIVNAPFVDDLKHFNQLAKEASLKQGDLFINSDERDRQDLIYITTFPWASLTQVTNAYDENPEDSIPRVCFSKFYHRDGKIMLPLSIEVHHGFVDGLHAGTFLQNVEKHLHRYQITK